MSDDARNKMKRTINILLLVSGIVSIVAVIFVFSVKSAGTIAAATGQVEPTVPPPLPPLDTNPVVSLHNDGIPRHIQLKTILPEEPTNKIKEYVVQKGDSPSSIAQKFDLKPETILWGNAQLNTTAGSLRAGDTLNILPVDGILHSVQDGDTLETLQGLHETPAQEILWRSKRPN